jgi:hypothetical protein
MYLHPVQHPQHPLMTGSPVVSQKRLPFTLKPIFLLARQLF